MRNLYLRIFVTFWTAMVLALAFSVTGTLWLEGQRQQRDFERQDDLAREASSVLASQGVPGLRDWLERESTLVAPDRLLALDPHGKDLLGRRVPEFLQVSAGRAASNRPPPGATRDVRLATRDVRLLSQLVTANDDTYALSLLRPPRRYPFGVLSSIEAPFVTLLATLAVSAILCFLLARYLSDPIRHLRAATRAIAAGDLRVRVSNLLGRRRDELALLAVDFDQMAERLRSLLESQRQLLRDVSHELRSPLARLQIALGLARRPNANLEQEFDRIEQETQRLDELIGEILSLSRLEDPSHELIAEQVNLEELLETLAENARVEAEPRLVRVELQVAAALCVEGDRELLFRAIENVVRNAVRFAPEGSAVELSARAQGERAVVRVVDHGPGVPPELLEGIFEPFFRVGHARDRDSGGYGIGLAITARVAALHGGSIRACNLPGGGLQVDMTLPRSLARTRPASSANTNAPAPAPRLTATAAGASSALRA